MVPAAESEGVPAPRLVKPGAHGLHRGGPGLFRVHRLLGNTASHLSTSLTPRKPRLPGPAPAGEMPPGQGHTCPPRGQEHGLRSPRRLGPWTAAHRRRDVEAPSGEGLLTQWLRLQPQTRDKAPRILQWDGPTRAASGGDCAIPYENSRSICTYKYKYNRYIYTHLYVWVLWDSSWSLNSNGGLTPSPRNHPASLPSAMPLPPLTTSSPRTAPWVTAPPVAVTLGSARCPHVTRKASPGSPG